MPRTETVLTIFVASPSDVSDERLRMEEIIREVNLTAGEPKGVRLELLKWETNTFPSAGERAQQVINTQIGDAYDIFVGIMWGRFGTSTGAYDSGTEEEFLRAKRRYDSGDQLDIMFYFKDEAIPPSKIDVSQLTKVKNFQSAISSGVYFRTFNTVDDFEKLFRMHITKKISDYGSSGSIRPNTISNDAMIPNDAVAPNDGDEAPGILDMQIQFEETAPHMVAVIERLGERTNWISDRLNEHTQAIRELSNRSFGVPNARDAAKMIDASAQDLEEYAISLDEINVEFSTVMDSNFKNIAAMALFYKSTPENEATEAIEAISSLREVIADAISGATEFRATVADLPRMTSKLNAAKRHVTKAMDRMLDTMALAKKLLDEALA